MKNFFVQAIWLAGLALSAPLLAQQDSANNANESDTANAEGTSKDAKPAQPTDDTTQGRVVAVEGESPGYKDIRVSDRSPSLSGQTGLWRVTSAKTGEGGYFDLGLHGRLYSGTDFIIAGSTDSAAYGSLSFGYTFNRYIEASVSGLIAANENSAMNPRTLFSTGDFGANLKFALPIWALAFGVDLGAFFPSGRDSIGPEVDNFSAQALGLLTLDLWQKMDIPLRLHANAGYRYQNRGAGNDRLLTGNVGHLLALTFEYTWYDRILYGLGAEVPLPYLTPFLELSGEYPLADGSGFTDSILRITPGLRFTAGRGLAFDLGADVTLLGGARLIEGVATPTPWMVHAGLSYNFSPFVAETRVEIREVEKRVELVRPVGFVAGRVSEKGSGAPVSGAILTFVNRDGPRIITDADGRYRSYGMDPGTLKVVASHPDYKSGEGEAVLSANDTVALEIFLVAEPKQGTLRGVIVDDKDASVAATLELIDDAGQSQNFAQAGGSYKISLQPGHYRAQVKAKGYLQQGRGIVIEKNGTSVEDFVLKKEPRRRVTILRTDRIEIKSTIYFEFNKARILAKSYHILDEVVDIMLKNPQVKKVRVEGHTDNVGDADYNRRLSQSRAQAVISYIAEHGVDPSRLDAVGYGEDKPLATNKTNKGRAQNRRVEFNIVDDNQAANDSAAQDQATQIPEVTPVTTTDKQDNDNVQDFDE